VTIEGPNKQVVGQVASEIRAYYPPEPYKGKGVKYSGREGRAQGRQDRPVNLESYGEIRGAKHMNNKVRLTQLRRYRIRKKVVGTKERPRMAVKFSNENIYVQFIDDSAGVTLASASTLNKNVPDRENVGANVKGATVIGKFAAEAARAKESSPSCLIAPGRVIMGSSRRWRTPRVQRVCSFN
jgi:large subunit ribosomal protein L18